MLDNQQDEKFIKGARIARDQHEGLTENDDLSHLPYDDQVCVKLYFEKMNDHAFMLKVVKQNGRALKYASAGLQNNKEIVTEAVKQNQRAMQYAHADLQGNKDVMKAAERTGGKSRRRRRNNKSKKSRRNKKKSKKRKSRRR
tara:strand:+ start:418 stop:843 length:426 start_codon:yes stop_codon:yes gene_type:complete